MKQVSCTGSSLIFRFRWGAHATSPCPNHYDGRLATMPSADFCLIINKVTPADAIGFHLVRSFQSMTLKSQGTYIPEPHWLVADRLLSRSLEGQPRPNKSMNFHCTAASFTVAVRTHGFVVLCQLTSSLRLI
jgi:hypothetical protein